MKFEAEDQEIIPQTTPGEEAAADTTSTPPMQHLCQEHTLASSANAKGSHHPCQENMLYKETPFPLLLCGASSNL